MEVESGRHERDGRKREKNRGESVNFGMDAWMMSYVGSKSRIFSKW